MASTDFNEKLTALVSQAVDYFQMKYITQFRQHLKQVQSDEDSGIYGNVHIYSHIDTDGLCAAAILASALRREGISYQITILKQLDEHYMPEIKKTMEQNDEFVFFLDFGSGQLNLISEYIASDKFIILDHHQPLIDENTNKIVKVNGIFVNPYFANVDGSTEISGSGITYRFTKSLRKDNVDLAYLAVIGAIGDHQHTGEDQSFIGENHAILGDALTSKLVVEEIEPALPRNESLPLGLANSLPVNLFDGDTQQSTQFLKKHGIKYESDLGHPRFWPDLSSSEKTKLTSSLVTLAKTEKPNVKITKLLKTHYLLTHFKEYPEIYDASDFSTMLNATGRLNTPSVGIACCLNGTNDVIIKAIKTSKLYVEKLDKGISWLIKGNKIASYKGINAFDGEDMIPELMVGVVCTLLIDTDRINTSKPIIGYADTGHGTYKISARCSQDLVIKGVDLSNAIRTVCKTLELKSRGGGHPPAAGASIPKDLIKSFLTKLGAQVRSQLGEDLKSTSKKAKSVQKKSKKDVSSKVTKTTAETDEKSKDSASKKKSSGLDQFFG